MEFLKARPLPWDDRTRSNLASSSLRQNSPLDWGETVLQEREFTRSSYSRVMRRPGGRWRTKQITNLCLTVTEVLMFISWNLEMCDAINIFKSQSDGMKRWINSTLKVELHQSVQCSQYGNGNISNGWKFTKAFLFFLILQLTPQDKTIILDVQVSILTFLRWLSKKKELLELNKSPRGQ